MNGINFWNGSKWLVMEKKFFNGVAKLQKVESIFKISSQKIEVQYANGDGVYYNNVRGTWGLPTKIKG